MWLVINPSVYRSIIWVINISTGLSINHLVYQSIIWFIDQYSVNKWIIRFINQSSGLSINQFVYQSIIRFINQSSGLLNNHPVCQSIIWLIIMQLYGFIQTYIVVWRGGVSRTVAIAYLGAGDGPVLDPLKYTSAAL